MKTLGHYLLDEWRQSYNPLRSLTMQRVVSLLEEGERGAYADLQWTYRTIEKRDATLRGLKRRLRSSVLKLDWNIHVIDELAEDQKALAESQREVLRKAYEQVKNMREAWSALVEAEFRGFCHLEKIEAIENGQVVIRELRPIPQWHICRDGIYGAWKLNLESTSGATDGEDLDMKRLIVREVEDPINEIALIAFVRKSLSQKDWDGFVESYGIPWLFLIAPEVAKDSEQEFFAVAQQIISDSRGVLPHGTEIKTADSGNRGVNPFRDHLKYQDEQLVLAGTSGLLTMLTAPGSGTLAGSAHTETFDEIAIALAADISEVFQEQFDEAILSAAFPGQPRLAYFEIAAKDEDDVDAVFERAVKARQAGLQLSPEELSEKTGYKIEAAPEPTYPTGEGLPVARPASTLFNRAEPTPPPIYLKKLKDAQQKDFERIIDRIREIEEAEDDETAAILADELLADLPELLPSPIAHETAAVLEGYLGSAAVAGARDLIEELTAETPGVLANTFNRVRELFGKRSVRSQNPKDGQ